jgi:3-oxoacyl-[acyl-carrier protein] reductase
VKNAIAWYPDNGILEQSLDAFDAAYRSSCSVLQTVISAKAFLPSMIERKYGRIIGISSEVAMQAMPRKAAHTSAKRGMDGVLRTLAREAGEHQVTVNQVAPGWMISDRDRGHGSERHFFYEKNVRSDAAATTKTLLTWHRIWPRT